MAHYRKTQKSWKKILHLLNRSYCQQVAVAPAQQLAVLSLLEVQAAARIAWPVPLAGRMLHTQ